MISAVGWVRTLSLSPFVHFAVIDCTIKLSFLICTFTVEACCCRIQRAFWLLQREAT